MSTYTQIRNTALAAILGALATAPAHAGSSDEIIKMSACKPGQNQLVLLRGADDGFSGSEVTAPRPALRNTPQLHDYHTLRPHLGPIRAYDDPRQNTWFIDTFTGLPGANVVSGTFMIAMRNPGGNDSMHIGDVADHFANSGQRVFGQRVNTLAWSKNGDTYHAPLSAITLRDNTTLLDHLASSTVFDVSVQDDTTVDFTGLVLCVEPSGPEGVISRLKNRMQCEPGLQKNVILRGSDTDAYAGIEQTTPRSSLATSPQLQAYHDDRPQLNGPRQYDDERQNAWFIDTLSGYPTGSITNGYFAIGMRGFGGNDNIHLGDVAGTFNGAYTGTQPRIFGEQANQIGWSMSGAGDAHFRKLSMIDLDSGESLLQYMNSNAELDVSVQDDTSIDFTALVYCSKG